MGFSGGLVIGIRDSLGEWSVVNESLAERKRRGKMGSLISVIYGLVALAGALACVVWYACCAVSAACSRLDEENHP